MTTPTDPGAPAPAPAPKKCANCAAPLQPTDRHCSSCGVTASARPKDDGLGERLARVEAQQEALAPVARFVERLKKRNIDPDKVTDEQLDMAEGLAAGGGAGVMAQVKQAMQMLGLGGGPPKTKKADAVVKPAKGE